MSTEHASGGRKIIEGIERIHWETTSVLCFCGSVIATMRYLGEPVTNEYVMGISGGAFKTFWHPNWSPANCDLLIYGEEPIRRTFNALGYEYAFIARADRERQDIDHAATREQFQTMIVESIDAGIPVIAQGIVGPPECSIVAGYEDGGDVLYGMSYFQENEDGYFRADDWYSAGIILIGGKREKPSRRQVLRDSLEFAIKLTREPTFEGVLATDDFTGMHYSGLKAYEVLADSIEIDEEFPAGDLETLTNKLVSVSNDGVCLLTGKRWFASEFLRSMASEVPSCSDELLAAADAYSQETGILQKAMPLTPWTGAPESARLAFADPSQRRQVAALVREARGCEERAVEHLERAMLSA